MKLKVPIYYVKADFECGNSIYEYYLDNGYEMDRKDKKGMWKDHKKIYKEEYGSRKFSD